MNFKQFYQISERTIGLSSDELSYVDILMQKIKDNCVPELWELGYAGLTMTAEEKLNKEYGLVIHDFAQPFPNLRISVVPYLKDAQAIHSYEPLVKRQDFPNYFSDDDKNSFSSSASRFFRDGKEELKGKSIISIEVPTIEMPEKLKWLEKNFITKFILNIIKKKVAPKVENLKDSLEHELIHYKDPSIKIRKSNSVSPEKPESDYPTNNYSGRDYYTRGGEISGGVPTEFHPRIWTIIRNCKSEQDKKELRDWIKRPVPILPKCMESETEFVKYTWENPSLRRMFLRKLYDGITGRVSLGKPHET